ncbi:hypothetical protein [Nocardioides sp.]|uniref:hypothetical protein n=1 Tax=Nocardioides sp. TaxID=35761 RepID=UPI00378482B8
MPGRLQERDLHEVLGVMQVAGENVGDAEQAVREPSREVIEVILVVDRDQPVDRQVLVAD